MLFWDEMPEGFEEHPDYVALQSIMTEGTTPESRAANFKDQGNKKLEIANKTRNTFNFQEAIGFYTKGIAEKCSDAKLNSQLYANRAHVQLILDNCRHAYNDARRAVEFDPSNLKAYFRAAKAALQLKQFAACRTVCERGLAQEPAEELSRMMAESLRMEEAEASKRQREEAEREKRLAPARKLVREMGNRGYRIGRPQFHAGDKRLPAADRDGTLHFPVLMFYPEVMGHDTIEDFSEEATLADHLDVIFAEDAPPLEWDSEGAYTRDRIECYYLSNACTELRGQQLLDAMNGTWPEGVAEDEGPRRYGKGAAQWVRAPEGNTLKEILQRPDHVVPGIPVFFLVARGTAFKDRFLEGELNRF